MPSTLRDRVSASRLAVFLALAAVLAALVGPANEPLTVEFVAMAVVVLGIFAASVFDAVREHPLYELASAVHTAVVFVLLYVALYEGVFLLALAGLAAVGVGVELYNLRHGTSYLRFGGREAR
ncbi:hypothetical protein SAMN04487947_0372 [Halogeometricum rufum]|uniref:Phosphatidate cytidylyltransferase n=1 Tax=Halogeometricum rufum TaxID=553469 RepID=A0A1I6G160_9EURY|nr:hypothetical protein [Halogeometricum rufum]SFR35797.1 hypothetical protein SAMN04487947_0372 [Halogeometricum rufum]